MFKLFILNFLFLRSIYCIIDENYCFLCNASAQKKIQEIQILTTETLNALNVSVNQLLTQIDNENALNKILESEELKISYLEMETVRSLATNSEEFATQLVKMLQIAEITSSKVEQSLDEAIILTSNQARLASSCVPNPCNGNPCVVDYVNNTHRCNCLLGYTGFDCSRQLSITTTPIETFKTTTIKQTTSLWLTEFNKFYHPCNRSLKGYTRLLRGINENCRFGYAGNQCHNLECAQNKDGLTACCQNDFGCNKCTEPCPNHSTIRIPMDCTSDLIEIINPPLGCVDLKCASENNHVRTRHRTIHQTGFPMSTSNYITTGFITTTMFIEKYTGAFYTNN